MPFPMGPVAVAWLPAPERSAQVHGEHTVVPGVVEREVPSYLQCFVVDERRSNAHWGVGRCRHV